MADSASIIELHAMSVLVAHLRQCDRGPSRRSVRSCPVPSGEGPPEGEHHAQGAFGQWRKCDRFERRGG
jgi:hypothetical protein